MATSRSATRADRTPAPRKQRGRRGFGDVMLALGAFVLLALLMVGVPLALAYLVGWPLPRELPSLDTVRQPLTLSIFIDVLCVLVWLAWAQFTACVLVEVKAAVSGVGMPTRIPAAGASQALARQLVAAVLLLTAGAASFAPGLSGLGTANHGYVPPRAASVAAAQHHIDLGSNVATPTTAQRDAAAEAPRPAIADQGTKLCRVHPPAGRHHDSLWGIAERHLGDGRRYEEIYQLNKDRPQPDGSRLTKASLIRPGWILAMPADAVGVDLIETHVAHEAAPPVSETMPQHGAAADADSGASVAPAEGRSSEVRQAVHSAPASTGDLQSRLPYELSAAALLAAGLLAALRRHRRTQLWHRAVGRRIHLPVGAGASAEEAIRLGAGEADVEFLDLALRSLAATLAERAQAAPPVYAARLRPDGLDLLLALPAGHGPGEPPAPWILAADGGAWHLPRHQLDHASVPRAAAPYPGLVSLGTEGPARLLIDLEAAPGVIAISGDEVQRRAVLAAIAMELATNSWSDRMKITLVGFDSALALCAPQRTQHVATLDELLPSLEQEFAERTAVLHAAGLDSVLTGRLTGAHGLRWAPHFVVVAEPPPVAAATRLAELAAGAGRIGVGYLVAGDVPGSAWQFVVDGAGGLRSELLGVDVDAQRLPESQYMAVLDLFRSATDSAGDPVGDEPPGGGAVGEPLPAEPDVYVRLLGELETIGAGQLDPERAELCEEALVYLLLHRDGVHPKVLASALWPRGVTAEVSDAVISRLCAWLGTDAHGAPNLAVDDEGRLRLGPGVRSDWEYFQHLRNFAASQPSRSDDLLAQALDLVVGPFLAGRPTQRFGWLAYETQDAGVPAAVADTALQLSELRLQAQDAAGAVDAVVAGMRGSPTDEELWRQLLRATHATGDIARLEGAVHELYRRTETIHGVHGLHPKTRALVDELLPSWRMLVAN